MIFAVFVCCIGWFTERKMYKDGKGQYMFAFLHLVITDSGSKGACIMDPGGFQVLSKFRRKVKGRWKD